MRPSPRGAQRVPAIRSHVHRPALLSSATMLPRLVAAALILPSTACGDSGGSSQSDTEITSATATTPTQASNSDSMSGTTAGSDTNTTSSSDSTPTTTGAPDTSDSDPAETGAATAPLLDVGNGESGFATGNDTEAATGCVGVDLLFVIDNSVSMGDYQNALGLAFPGFADAIVQALPPGTNLHVGVTSTTMGYSSSGSTTNCDAKGDNDQPQDFFYETPDLSDNGLNGAQGRLYKGGGPTFYDIDTDASPAELAALKTWFADAAKIGEGGSQIEMSAAAAGWVADPANAATNAGFIRDEGAVLAIFILQDEPDQTPHTIDGKPGGQAMLDKLIAAKTHCGGADCIIGGGFVDTGCFGEVALGGLMNGFGTPPNVQDLPDEDLAEDFPDQAAAEMNQLLADTLAGVIKKKCDEIMPPI